MELIYLSKISSQNDNSEVIDYLFHEENYLSNSQITKVFFQDIHPIYKISKFCTQGLETS